ncbi:hypothetical protein WAH83_20715, partial [Acinetobacter baumannii]
MPYNVYKNKNAIFEGHYNNTSLGANTYLLGVTS